MNLQDKAHLQKKRAEAKAQKQLSKSPVAKKPKVVTGLLKSSAKQSNATFASMFSSAADKKGKSLSLQKGARRLLGMGNGEVLGLYL